MSHTKHNTPSNNTPSQNIFIKDLIRHVHDELIASQEERISKNIEPLFVVNKLTIEANFILTDEQNVSGGADIRLLKADANASYKKEQIHKIILELTTPAINGSSSNMGSLNGSGGGGQGVDKETNNTNRVQLSNQSTGVSLPGHLPINIGEDITLDEEYQKY